MKVNDRITMLETSKGAYVYLLDAGEKILVDTGLPFRGTGIQKELAGLVTAPTDVKHILLTHYDVDHIGNAARLEQLTKASVWASAEEIPYIMGEKPKPGFKKHIARIFRCGKPTGIQPLGIALPGGEGEIIPAPGHTPGHVCVLFHGALFAGDIVENHKGVLRPYPAGWNWDTTRMMASIRELDKLEFQWVCPAHGRPIGREAWDEMMKHEKSAG